MDHDIEWLFEEVYKIKKSGKEIQFISDWDVNQDESVGFKNLLQHVYNEANNNSARYNYSYEQFALKNQIIELLRNNYKLQLEEVELTITPSATVSLHLVAQGLVNLGLKRFLIITPAYFSTHEVFNKAGCEVFYYHLKDEQNLQINFVEIETIIQEQYLEGIILTDPIYCAGIEFIINDYSKLSEICRNNDLYFVVDYSLGGLSWDITEDYTFNSNKISILKTCEKFIFIDTLSKRLLLNGIKFSIIIGDENIIDKIDLISEFTYGGLSSAQCFLIKELYRAENQKIISTICQNNIRHSKDNYNLIKSLLLGSDFYIENTNSGYFSLINHKKFELNSVDTKLYSLNLLENEKILCITKDRFTFYSSNKFGFRINLNKKSEQLIIPVKNILKMNFPYK